MQQRNSQPTRRLYASQAMPFAPAILFLRVLQALGHGHDPVVCPIQQHAPPSTTPRQWLILASTVLFSICRSVMSAATTAQPGTSAKQPHVTVQAALH